jgi:uncharacterized protein (DUF433 family)
MHSSESTTVIIARENSFRFIGNGIYTVPDAAKLARIPQARIRRWIRGYHFRTSGELRSSPPIVPPFYEPVEGHFAISFLDLVELRFVNAFLEHGVSWTYLRDAYQKAIDLVGRPRPFSTKRFKTDGRGILTEIMAKGNIRSVLDVGAGQLGFWPIIAPFYRELEFDRDEVSRWWPGANRNVVIDPERSFGKPIVAREGIPTRILYKAYIAEGSLESVASWYGVRKGSVKAAVDFEVRLAA